MPIDPATLIDEIRKFADDTHPEFSGFPTNAAETASKWAAALKAYFTVLGTPFLIPGTLDLSEAAMVAAMTPLCLPIPGIGATALGAGFAAFVLPFVVGGLPAVVLPPPALFVPPSMLPTDNAIAAAALLAGAVDAWARTGLSGIPPALPVTPWA